MTLSNTTAILNARGYAPELNLNKKYVAFGVLCAVLLVLAAAYVGVSWRVGGRIQNEARQGIDKLNVHLERISAKPITVTETQYSRGIFSSQVAYTVSIPSASKDASPLEVIITNQIDHGPLPLHAAMKGKFDPALALVRSTLVRNAGTQALFNLTKGESFLDGDTVVHLDGSLNFQWRLLPLDFTQKDVRSNFSGATLKAFVGINFANWQGDLVVPSLVLTNPTTTIELNGARLYTNSQTGLTDINIGTRGATLQSLTITNTSTPSLNLKNIETRLVLNETASLLDGLVQYEIGRATLGKKDLGQLKLTASFDHLNAQAISNLIDLHHSLLVRSLNNSPDTDLVTPTDIKLFWQQASTLLKDKPNFRLDPVAWTTPIGNVQFALNLGLGPVELKDKGIGLVDNPTQNFSAKLQLSKNLLIEFWSLIKQAGGMPETKARQAAEKELVAGLLMANIMKLVKVSGDAISTSLELDKTQNKAIFKLNGNPVPTDLIAPWLESVAPSGWLSDDSPSPQQQPDEASSRAHLDPSVLTAILTGAGYNHEVRKDEQGDPIIQIAAEGTGATKIDFIFIGCGEDPTCEDVLMRATYNSGQAEALKVVNDWNRKNRWARAYVNKKQEPTIEMDINGYGGINRDSVQNMVTSFFGIVKDFAKELNPKASD